MAKKNKRDELKFDDLSIKDKREVMLLYAKDVILQNIDEIVSEVVDGYIGYEAVDYIKERVSERVLDSVRSMFNPYIDEVLRTDGESIIEPAVVSKLKSLPTSKQIRSCAKPTTKDLDIIVITK